MKKLYRPMTITAIIAIVVLSVLTYNSKFNNLIKDIENNENTKYSFTCVISEYPLYDDDKIKLYCDIKSTDYPIDIVDRKILLNVSKDYYDICTYGSKIKFSSVLKSASVAMNYGNFSYRNYLKSKNVIGIVSPDGDIEKLPSEKGIDQYIYSIRRKSINYINTSFSGDDRGLIKAIITGDRADITDKMYDSYKKTGIYHIVAVSGLHVGIIITLITQLMFLIKMKSRRKAILTRILSIVVAILFFIFTGYGVSILRVILMLSILMLSLVFRRKYSITTSIISSALVIALIFPYYVFSISYQLSFFA